MPLVAAIQAAGPKPPQTATRTQKKNYAERLSNEVAKVLAERLRAHGVKGCQPDPMQGRERQFAGGIGAKKVDVSFATEVDGLILGISVKSISFPDKKTMNYQKNLTNRRGDLLAEATTLHQRFPYAVLGGLFLFDEGRLAITRGVVPRHSRQPTRSFEPSMSVTTVRMRWKSTRRLG